MRPGLLAGAVVASLVASGALAILTPSALSLLFGTTDSSDSVLDCEDLVDGDRIEIRDDVVDGRREIRVEADTRVRAEARFEMEDGSGIRREARVELCGIVEFADEDGDGALGAGDNVVSSELVRFGTIDHVAGEIHRFEVESDEANMTVTARIPDAMPPTDAPLIEWNVVANPPCGANATHFAVKVEHEEPSSRDEFGASPCGTPLEFSGDESSPGAPVETSEFECEDEANGSRFAFSLAEQDGEDERRWQGQVDANTRMRAEVRLDNGSDSVSGEGDREARVELCGVLQFADEDGDGQFGLGDTIVSRTLVPLGSLVHGVDEGFHVLIAGSEDGRLTITIRASATFPRDDEPLLRWAVEANPVCEAGATHFTIKVEQESPAAADRFLAGACGSILSATGEVG